MVSRYRGKVGEYLWEKEKQRLERYQDRPWEYENRSQGGSELLVLLLLCLSIPGVILLLSLF